MKSKRPTHTADFPDAQATPPPEIAQLNVPPASAGKVIEVSKYAVGDASKLQPLSALQQWGVYFVVVVGGWILVVGLGVLAYAFHSHPQMPNIAGMGDAQAKDVLNNYKQLTDYWRDSLVIVFDLLVTKTTLPIVTLLLGYLFGKKE